MQSTNLKNLLYSQTPTHNIGADKQLQTEIVILKTQLDTKTKEYILSQDENLRLQKDMKELQESTRRIVYEHKQHPQKIQELETELALYKQDSGEYKVKVQHLELIKYDQQVKIDELTAKLLEWQQNYSILYNNFQQRLDEEITIFRQNQQQELNERDQINDLRINDLILQINQLQADQNQYQTKIKELDNEALSYKIRAEELLNEKNEQENLINQAYHLFKGGNQNQSENMYRELILQMSQKLDNIDGVVLKQFDSISIIDVQLKKIQTFYDQLLQNFVSLKQQEHFKGKKTLDTLKDQLGQKQIDNIQLNQEIKQLKQTLTQQMLASQLNNTKMQKSYLAVQKSDLK